ncbi:hypothetical protein [Flavobacterium gilvum]|uniref:Uncharacterized protein n=1 Tax=Flavobacterium gilvum TaxID=1492737 RepID=A0AAC9I563_9FLAO|nr:hypothetical protein [Flavobacterium gilvum]AOW08117.1 hypothetical protein EM308_00570 [Flavobacterium gilvum]KFC58888.1 hypothetical protein FEM08_23760 [Flavobacterium gilvum]
MNKVYQLLGNKKSLNLAFLLFVLVYLILFAITLFNSDGKVGNNDNYKDLFVKFYELGFYQATVQGTSIVYNLFLSFIFSITKNVETSFFVLNLFSDLFLMFFGYYFYHKTSNLKNNVFYIVLSMYILFVLNMRSYLSASNDSFLGVFVVILLYLIVIKLFEGRHEKFTFLCIGFIFAICLSIRITAVLLIPLIFIAFFYWIKNTDVTFLKRVQLIGICSLMFLLTILVFHFPAIKEKHSLSYEDKNPSKDLNWIQRNYLGLKKIESGQEKIHRDAIWKNTKFEKVQEYLKIHGANSLPKTFTQAVFKDPVLVFKITFLNVITCLARFFRFWGFLFSIPIIMLFRGNFFNKYKLPTILFLSFLFILSFVCFTFMEFRWFYGYEILIPISILYAVNKIKTAIETNKINSIIVASLLMVTLFNVKTILSIL